MGVKWKTKKDDLGKMEKSVKGLNGRKVFVGVIDNTEQAYIASIHEYGCSIRVTPRMRAYLHRKGLHIKASTTEIVIPERSFLRSGYDEHKDEVLKKADRMLLDVLLGTMKEETFLKEVGLALSSKIKDYATDLRTPANHPFTIAQKGSSNPLVDTGDMIDAITYDYE